MPTLRTKLIRLAHAHQEFQGYLLPMLREAEEFSTQDALDKYLKEHPGADPKNHSVKKPSSGFKGHRDPEWRQLMRSNPKSKPEQKDRDRVHKILDNNDVGPRMTAVVERMANSITDPMKAWRRGMALLEAGRKNVYISSHPRELKALNDTAALFFQRAFDLSETAEGKRKKRTKAEG